MVSICAYDTHQMPQNSHQITPQPSVYKGFKTPKTIYNIYNYKSIYLYSHNIYSGQRKKSKFPVDRQSMKVLLSKCSDNVELSNKTNPKSKSFLKIAQKQKGQSKTIPFKIYL